MPSPEQLLELTFPLKGINTETEFQLQPDDTTPIAINVRSIDPVEHRNRGASRCGIRKYVDQKLGLLSLIQHLNVIVDPTIEATLSEVDSVYWQSGPDSGLYPGAPRGRQMRRSEKWMRKGGSGVAHREARLKPRAVDDTINMSVIDAPITIQPLANDFYSGAATFRIVATSPNFVGEYSVAGPIGGWDFTYTPPYSGETDRTIYLRYTLTALGNKGTAAARIIINLTGEPDSGDYPPSPPPPPTPWTPTPGLTYEYEVHPFYYLQRNEDTLDMDESAGVSIEWLDATQPGTGGGVHFGGWYSTSAAAAAAYKAFSGVPGSENQYVQNPARTVRFSEPDFPFTTLYDGTLDGCPYIYLQPCRFVVWYIRIAVGFPGAGRYYLGDTHLKMFGIPFAKMSYGEDPSTPPFTWKQDGVLDDDTHKYERGGAFNDDEILSNNDISNSYGGGNTPPGS